MRTADERLEDNLRDFMSSLDPELGTLRHMAGGFVTLFTETALGLFVLEHALRRKGVLDDDDLAQALREAQAALHRIGSHGLPPPGTA